MNGRTSTIPNRATGCFEAILIASSRSGQSMMSKPPTHSFVSVNGPSVTSTLPSRTRTVVASSAGRSRSPTSDSSRPTTSATHSAMLSWAGS